MFRIDQYLVPCSNSENKGKRNPSHQVRFKCKVVRNSVNQLVKSVTNSELFRIKAQIKQFINLPSTSSHTSCTECATLWTCYSFPLPGVLFPRHVHSSLLRCLIRDSLPDSLHQIYKIASPIFVLVFFLVSYIFIDLVCVYMYVYITVCLIHYYWFCSFFFTAFLTS